MRKVIYVSWTKLTDKYAEDWFINHLILNMVEVEYWDIVELMREKHNEVGELHADYLRVVQSFKEFESLIQKKENVNAIYVMLITPSWNTRLPFLLLSKYECTMLYINWGIMPELALPIFQRAIFKITANPLKFLRTFFGWSAWGIYKKIKFIKPFDIMFSAGDFLSKKNQDAKKIVLFNLCDYDNYVRIATNSQLNLGRKYAVFLDVNLPHHSDLGLLGWGFVDSELYYQSLNRFFVLVERQYGVQVIIAAHPKSCIDKAKFNQRSIYRLSTPELVKDAEFVITHHSTALSYGVLNYKPIIFIYTEEMFYLYKKTIIKNISEQAAYLKSPLYNIDLISDPEDILVEMPTNIIYENYKYSFLTTKESENSSSRDIFFREITLLE